MTGLERLFKPSLNKRSSPFIRVVFLKYNHAEALNTATELFWKKGYQGTKMHDLQEHLDMRLGSIYTGFGSKEALFLQVLNCYVEHTLSKINEYNRLATHPLEALKDFVSDFILVDAN